MKTIFITIPSYEDPDLVKTIDAAIENASYPKNLHFAIALQYKVTPMPPVEKYYKRSNMKFTNYDVDTRPGVCQVRHDLLKLYDGEDYLLMIDSHMTFMPNWDELLIREYEIIRQQESNRSVILTQSSGEVPVISCICFNNDDICENGHKTMIFKTEQMKQSLNPGYYPPRHIQDILERDCIQVATNTNKNYERVLPLAAGCFFSSAEWISEVGIVDGVNISGEEVFMAFRSYLAGWDAYTLKNIEIIGHDARNYNVTVFGEELPRKLYSRYGDEYHISSQINHTFLFNSGRFAIENPKRTPEDFWSELGMLENLKWVRDFCEQIDLYKL